MQTADLIFVVDAAFPAEVNSIPVAVKVVTLILPLLVEEASVEDSMLTVVSFGHLIFP